MAYSTRADFPATLSQFLRSLMASMQVITVQGSKHQAPFPLSLPESDSNVMASHSMFADVDMLASVRQSFGIVALESPPSRHVPFG